jgi:acetyl-CoA carboxylase biotin carboxyl carrier protein
MMQIRDIIELMEKMNQTGLNVLEFEADGSRLRLEKNNSVCAMPQMSDYHERAASMTQSGPADAAAEMAAPELPGHLVTSPVVGIFYSSPSPDSEPFVTVNSTVEIGSPLCIIEAMKLMNEVTSPWEGIILEIFVENGQRVEFGQPLMRIGGN